MRAFGAIVSFRVKGGKEETVKFSESLKSILIAESLGATKTYVNIPSLMTHLSVPPDQRLKLGITDDLIRVSVGTAEPEDLLKDLDQALSKI